MRAARSRHPRGRPVRVLAQPARPRRRRRAADARLHLGRYAERRRRRRASAPPGFAGPPLPQPRPAVFARAATWCGFGEYLTRRLTGRLQASISMASGTGLMDQTTGGWDRELLAACDIGPERLPPI